MSERFVDVFKEQVAQVKENKTRCRSSMDFIWRHPITFPESHCWAPRTCRALYWLYGTGGPEFKLSHTYNTELLEWLKNTLSPATWNWKEFAPLQADLPHQELILHQTAASTATADPCGAWTAWPSGKSQKKKRLEAINLLSVYHMWRILTDACEVINQIVLRWI